MLYTLAESDNPDVQRKASQLSHLYDKEPELFFECAQNFSNSESGLVRLIALDSLKTVFEKHADEWTNPQILDFDTRIEQANAAFEEIGGLNKVLANDG